MSSNQRIPPSGLTVLVSPDEPSLDIIFIHGFTGHPERTWTHQKGEPTRGYNDDNDHGDNDSFEPPSKLRKLTPFTKSPTSRGHSYSPVYWPKDLLPTIVPGARVMTYGYDTHLGHRLGPPRNRNTVYDIAWDFLVALESERRGEPGRPALFIAHSLGGIIVKEMLRRSSGCHLGQTYLRHVFESTQGIIFFGTPHAGADPRGFLQHIAEKVVKIMGFSVDSQIVNTLLPTSERLQELRVSFGPMAQEQHWTIHSFQEQVGVQALGYKKVVEDPSSCLNIPAIETTEHIGRNHMDMCRFTGLDDMEFKKVSAALQRMTEVFARRPGGVEGPQLNTEQTRALLDSLKFSQIDSRQMSIKNAYAQTCKWVLNRSEHRDWLNPDMLDRHHGLLWIKGKPGTGKSTLMKFLLANSRRTMRGKVIISFFFHARGEDLEKSTIGMFRSLLLQLLVRIPTLQRVFDSLEMATQNGQPPQWSIEWLKALFEQAVQSLGQTSVVCLIDALDECDEHQVRDMVSFFEHVGGLAMSSGLKFRVCFSSRHYPHITIQKAISLVLEGQEGHNQDITNYIHSELKIGHSKLAETIRAELQEKAAGIFMWVVLVVEILNKEHDGGRIHALRRKLRDIPGDLHELFRRILARDGENKDELLLCIQWVLFAKEPLQPQELYFAILSGIDVEALAEWDPDEITAAVIERFLVSASKGLVEVTKSNVSKVQFIHESVNDFLVKENGFHDIWPHLGSKFEGHSHDKLKQCCLRYISVNHSQVLSDELSLNASSTSVRQSAINSFPFLEYATCNVLHHANLAEGFGTSQRDFISHFPRENWVKLSNVFEKHTVRRHTSSVSVLYLLAENNLSHLMRVHANILGHDKFIQASLAAEIERYGPPLLAAVATGSNEAVQVFLDTKGPEQSAAEALEIQSQPSSEQSSRSVVGRAFKFSKRKGILPYVVEHGDERLSAFILAPGRLELEAHDGQGQTPLSWAVRHGHLAIARLLINQDANLETKDREHRTPLWWAVKTRSKEMVQLLLDQSVNPETPDISGRTPLSLAAGDGRKEIVRLLLDQGVNPETPDNIGRTPLSFAAGDGRKEIVRLLLDQGVNPETPDILGRTPLSFAAGDGRKEIVRLLLDQGINPETPHRLGRTPLSFAAEDGREEIVRLLLDQGVNPETPDILGRTPLSFAVRNGREEIVRLLSDVPPDTDD